MTLFDNWEESMKRNSKRSLHSGSALLSVSFLFACHAAGAADPLPRSAPATAGFSAAALERIDRFYAERNDLLG